MKLWPIAQTQREKFFRFGLVNNGRQLTRSITFIITKCEIRPAFIPLRGATDLLAWLKKNDIPALVVSNKSGPHLRQEAKENGWDKYFISIVGAHDAARDKPAREHADMALRQAGLESGPDILFVGDSESDILCARNTGCTPFLIGTSDFAEKHGVHLYANDCRELLEMLECVCLAANNKKKE